MTRFLPSPGLIADIGGTNARFVLVGEDGAIGEATVLSCADFDGLETIVRAFLDLAKPAVPPRRAAIAVASPVTGDRVTMTNRDWVFSIEETRHALGLDRLDVLNDFTAVALSILHLEESDFMRIGGGEAAPNCPVAVLGPGTGLGVSAVIPAPGGWVPLVTEGGHVTMAATNEREAAALAVLRDEFGHASAERVLSGRGLVLLQWSLCRLTGAEVCRQMKPEQVTEMGLAGTQKEAVEALDMFCAMLGTIAGNLALTLGARGGVYIAGGIVPRLGEAFARSAFRERFEAKGRFAGYMAAIPTAVVTREHPAFLGLSRFLSRD